MKTLSLFFIICAIHCTADAQQKVFSFKEAETRGISIEEIEQNYKDAIHVNPNLAVFADNRAEFIETYRAFIQRLARYLNENDFFWEDPTRIFNRVYFSKTGEIEYFFYNDEDANFTPKKMEKFNTLLAGFANNYILDIEADTAFAQCSPVIYTNVINKN